MDQSKSVTSGTVNIDITNSSLGNLFYTTGVSGGSASNISTVASSSAYTFTTGSTANNFSYSSNLGVATTSPNSGLHVNGDAEFEGDIKVKGTSLTARLEAIEKRLSILVPDPDKLEHFEALKKAYEHYKTLEALCQLPDKEEK